MRWMRIGGAPTADCGLFAAGIQEVAKDDALRMKRAVQEVGECRSKGPGLACEP